MSVRVRITRPARGFSLIELMVGMLLGIILMGGAISIYLASKSSFVEAEQVAALSENARFAEQRLSDAMRLVGFFGETTAGRVDLDPNLSSVVGDCTGDAAVSDVSNFAFAATADGSGNALGCIDDAVPNTDVLVLKHVLPLPYSDGPRGSLDPNNPSHGDGTIDTPGPLSGEKMYVMTNNLRGLLFDGADTAPTIVTGGDIPNGVAWEYQFEIFYVRDNANGIPSLSRKHLEWNGSAMELETENVAEGVEDLHFQFGYDSNNSGEVDTYADISTVGANWPGVTSIEAFMLVRSAVNDPQYTDVKSYNMGDPNNPFVPDSNTDEIHYRRTVSFSSISLRNLKLIVRGGA